MCKKCETVETVEACESCIAYAGMIDGSYWDGYEADLDRIEAVFVAGGIATLCETYANDDEEHAHYPLSHFSMDPCQVCGSTLGGDRYPVQVVTKGN